MRQRQFEFKPQYWQAGIGLPLATALDKIIYHCGFLDRVAVVSFPDEKFLIKIFRLDPEGEIFSKISGRRGFEFVRIEIGFPDKFSFLLIDYKKKRERLFEFRSSGNLAESSKDLLERTLCAFWLDENP
jgi:hypothetical protein